MRLVAIFLLFSSQGTSSELLVSPAGPTEMNVLAGSNVTLAVSFRGPRGPALTWYQGDFPVVTWIIDSPLAPVVAEGKRMVLRVELNGSLTFINVTPSCTSNYTVEMIKSGVGKSSTTFSLKVFEKIQEVTLRPQPDFAAEGDELFSLQYSVLRGVVEEQTWFFNGTRIKSNSHHSVENRRLWIRRPHRNDTGQYSVTLTNPFSSGTARFNVTVRYGPEEPRVWADPAQPFYVSGDSLTLTCQADGFPQPSAEWLFGGQTLPESHRGVLNIPTVQLSQGGVYTCELRNEDTTQHNTKSITVNVYERPPGDPVCSVQSVKDTELQYHCQWLGGAPEALLSFPGLNTTSSGAANFNLNATATDNLNGETVICKADHPVEQNRCNITARSPAEFLPAVRTVNLEGKIVVSIVCVSEASPKAVVSWFKGGVALTNDTTHQISSDTTQLNINHYNVSSFLHQNYACMCRNPLGNQSREIQLKGPSVSRLSVVLSPDGTTVTLTWQVPSSSVVTGFDIQMKGPDLQNHNGSQSRGSSDRFRTITQAAGAARTTDIYGLNPESTYRFRVIPKAHTTEGEPSEVRRIGPGEGLSGPAIAGIAAGIPCSLLFLLLLCGFIYLLVYCSKKKSRQTRYPVSRAIEKMTTQTEPTPHNLLSGGLKSLPDYNRLQQRPSERSVTLPNFVPPPPVRVATTV